MTEDRDASRPPPAAADGASVAAPAEPAPGSADAPLDGELERANERILAGDPAGARVLAEELHARSMRAGRARLAARAATLAAKAALNQHDVEAAQRWADVVVDAGERDEPAAGVDEVAVARTVRAVAYALGEHGADAAGEAAQALALLEVGADMATQLTVLNGVAIAYDWLGLPQRAHDVLMRVLELRADASASTRLWVRANLAFATADAFDQTAPSDPAHARAMLTRVLAELPALADAAQAIDRPFARLAWANATGRMLLRDGRANEAEPLLHEVVDAGVGWSVLAWRRAALDLAQLVAVRGDVAAARSIARRVRERLPAEPSRWRASEVLEAVALAELDGRADDALRLHRRYHAAALRHERAVLDARIAELTVTVLAQSMRLEIAGLRRENATLSDAARRLDDLAHVDPLTGALNRRGMLAAFDALRRATRRPALAMVDLDHFKRINDRFAHAVGDAVLRRVARELAAAMRGDDRVARFGGEEFVLLLGDSASCPTTAVERLREHVAALDWPEHPGLGSVTFSAGVVVVGADETLDGAIARADRLLYAAKAAGRDRVVGEAPAP